MSWSPAEPRWRCCPQGREEGDGDPRPGPGPTAPTQRHRSGPRQRRQGGGRRGARRPLAGVPVAWAKHDFSWDRELARPLGALSDLRRRHVGRSGPRPGGSDTLLVPPPRPIATPASAAAAGTFWAAHGVDLGAGADRRDGRTAGPLQGRSTPRSGRWPGTGASTWRLVVVGADDPTAAGEATGCATWPGTSASPTGCSSWARCPTPDAGSPGSTPSRCSPAARRVPVRARGLLDRGPRGARRGRSAGGGPGQPRGRADGCGGRAGGRR